jgi:hypothetical protein
MASAIAGFIGAMALMVVIFLLCRAIVLWYWRVNEGIALLKSIDEKLGQMAATRVVVQAPVARAVGNR